MPRNESSARCWTHKKTVCNVLRGDCEYNDIEETMKRIAAPLLLFFLILAPWHPARAETIDSKYFSETGHNVMGDFLAFYQAKPNAVTFYGYPITEQFTDRSGLSVQYFQRARFEYRPDMPEGQRVQPTPLGREMYETLLPLDISNAFSCKTFGETGFSVCFDFLEFFEANGGAANFGFPISGFEYHENKLVQYFERVRLEWQPWRAEGYRVVISDLGRAYFDKLNEDPALLAPVSPLDNAPRVVTSLHVRAFAWKAVTLSTDSQSFFIIVQDQNLQSVAGASCKAVVNWPNGAKDSTDLPSDPNGLGIVSLQFFNQPHGGLVYMEIACSYNGLSGKTTTSFRIWY